MIAAKLVGETAGASRFSSDGRVARVATIDALLGNQRRHRLNRHGNRQLNPALHKIAVVEARWDARAREYLDRRRAEGKTQREASSATSLAPS